MSWDEKARQNAVWCGYNSMALGVAEAKGVQNTYSQGAKWQRDQLRTPEAIERGARALNASGWVCFDCEGEPGDYDNCAACQRVCKNVTIEAITALLKEN